MDVIEYYGNLVKDVIEKDFKNLELEEIERFFEDFIEIKGNKSFINFYNKTVLYRERIKFGEFKRQWAIQGMTREVYSYFDEHQKQLIAEIKTHKNIQDFFYKYCIQKRREGSFCSKLFHTILPSEFPPVDSKVRERFNLQNEDYIKSVLIIKKGYEMFIKENPELIHLFRKVLMKDMFSILRVNELSDIRILDMYYWSRK